MKPLHIDIPVTLKDVKVVFSIGALAFEGDLPASVFHLRLISNDSTDSNAKNGDHCRLSHATPATRRCTTSAYNADRNISTGNPYKDLRGRPR